MYVKIDYQKRFTNRIRPRNKS